MIASACTRAPTPPAPTNKAVKPIKHAFGETEVPTNPTRVGVLGYIAVEAVVDHGLQPIGVPDGLVDSLQGNASFATDMRTEIDHMKAHPLWSQLKAVKNNQVYEVDSHWMNGSYISANLILDDLLTYIGG